jgi:hypothetical protein
LLLIIYIFWNLKQYICLGGFTRQCGLFQKSDPPPNAYAMHAMLDIPFECFIDFFADLSSSEINISAIFKDVDTLRGKIVFWAIMSNLTDLVETDRDLLNNFFEAKLRPNSLTSDDFLSFATDPKGTICQSNVIVKVLVHPNVTTEDIQVSIVDHNNYITV